MQNFNCDGLEHLRERIENRKIGDDVCFFCAHQHNKSSMSMEHVFPRWLQEKFDIWDNKISLLNKTMINYRQLLVPCCPQCNNKYLSKIERDVKFVCENGIKAVEDFKLSLFLWLSKIWYGMLYKELFLPYDRSIPEFGNILDGEIINQYCDHLEFMQAARDEILLKDFDPFSIFAFECQTIDTPSLNYDYFDDAITMVSAMRMGKVGIIMVFRDGGAQSGFADALYEETPYPLHPLQFREMCAKIIYKESIRDRTPKRIAIEAPGKIPEYYQLPLLGFSLKPYYRDWDIEIYAKYLSALSGIGIEDIYKPPNRIVSWLTDNHNQPRYIPFKT